MMATDSLPYDALIKNHDALAEDLAAHLAANTGRMIWTDMQLGPSGSCRPDVYSIARSFSHPRPTAYEVKTSVADFRADVTRGKWSSYLTCAQCVIFAVPRGLVKAADVPAKAGLMVRSPEGWRTVKRATTEAVRLKQDTWVKLLIDGVQREFQGGARAQAARATRYSEYRMLERVRAALGDEVAEVVGDLRAARDRLASLRADAETYRATVARERERFRNEEIERRRAWVTAEISTLLESIGLPPEGAEKHVVSARIAEVRRYVAAGREGGDVDVRLRQIIEAVDMARRSLANPLGDVR